MLPDFSVGLLTETVNLQKINCIIKIWIIVQCISTDLIGLAAMVYEPLYHAREIATI